MTLRIGIDGHVLTGKFQGIRTWLLEILRRAPALTPEITYVVYSDDPEACARLVNAPNIEYRKIAFHSPIMRILFYWPYAALAHRLDCLLTQYMAPPFLPIEQVVVIHDILFETHPQFFPFRTRWRNKLLVHLSALLVKRVVTVSRYSARQIGRIYGLKPDRIAIVRNGVDAKPAGMASALPPGLDPQTPYVLAVGRLEPRKNIRLALEALERITMPEARLVVVGRDDFELPETLARLKAEPRAIQLMDVPEGELRALYAHARALVYPSEGEGWGIPVLEAMAEGCPVIASSLTAIPEAGGSACHYFDPQGPDAASELAGLMEEALRGTLSFDAEAAARHVAAHSWDAAARDFAHMLRQSAKTHAPILTAAS